VLAFRGVPRSKLKLMYNWAPPTDSDPEPLPQLAARERLNLPRDAFIAMYAGNHGAVQGLDTIIRAATRVEGHVHIAMVGDGAEKDALVSLAERLNCTNVHFLGAFP